MWIKTHTKTYPGVKAADIWRLWTDVNNYTCWHDDLDYCKMEGAFTVGNYFMLKPKGAPAVKVELIEVVEGHKFADCTKFPGAKMYDIHEMEETAEGLRITSTIKVTGILQFIWVKLVAQNVAATALREMDALVALARSNNG